MQKYFKKKTWWLFKKLIQGLFVFRGIILAKSKKEILEQQSEVGLDGEILQQSTKQMF